MVYTAKTFVTDTDVQTFLDGLESEQRRNEGAVALTLFGKATGAPAKMWGPSIIGFGHYHYKYDSGHEGDSLRIGFSPRKAQLVFYLKLGDDAHSGLLAKLGKHSTGKGCLYIKKLADIDLDVLEELIALSWAKSLMDYPGS